VTGCGARRDKSTSNHNGSAVQNITAGREQPGNAPVAARSSREQVVGGQEQRLAVAADHKAAAVDALCATAGVRSYRQLQLYVYVHVLDLGIPRVLVSTAVRVC
jgi:hypothetical protein